MENQENNANLLKTYVQSTFKKKLKNLPLKKSDRKSHFAALFLAKKIFFFYWIYIMNVTETNPNITIPLFSCIAMNTKFIFGFRNQQHVNI